jgi:hypothetical protein
MQAYTSNPVNVPHRASSGEQQLARSRAREESLLDEALAATFPCSDPVSSLTVDD